MSGLSLDDILEKLKALPPEQQEQAVKMAEEGTKGMLWIPNPGPQTDAYFSKADLLYYGGAAGGGKDLWVDTPILTTSGWKRLRDIRAGDRVFDETGAPCNVVAVSETMLNPCYRVEFSDGAELIAGQDHEWVTQTDAERLSELRSDPAWKARRRKSRESRATGRNLRPHVAKVNAERAASARKGETRKSFSGVRTTAELCETLTVRGGKRLNHSVSVPGAVQMPDADLPIDPWLLGAWLGDGTSQGASLTIADEQVLEVATEVAANAGWCVTNRASRYGYGVAGGMQVELRALDLLNNKHIPRQYMEASIPQRVALLQGLMDTDGTANARGQCEFDVTRLDLASDVLELVRGLGCKATMRVGVAKLNGRAISPKYRIKFMASFPAFRLQRKLDRQKMSGFRPTVSRKYITACERVKTVPTCCIQVDSPSRCYLAGPELTVTHNSQLLLGLAANEHRVSRLFRRQFKDIDGEGGLAPGLAEIVGSTKGYNSQKHVWKIPTELTGGIERAVEFGAFESAKDAEAYQGRAADFYGFDEAVQFQEDIVDFIMGWNRTTIPGQRCRVVLASNPPLTPEGLWIFDWFAPWLDPEYADPLKKGPAKPGELRWFTKMDGHMIEVEEDWVGYITDSQGKQVEVRPKSRTFIPAALSDNPDLLDSGYASQLANLPAHLQDALLRGQFTTTMEDAERQVIPTEWVLKAQERWRMRRHEADPNSPLYEPMTALGVDMADGGQDRMTCVPLHKTFFDEPVVKPGKEVDTTDKQGAMILGVARDDPQFNIDCGGGYGSGVSSMLESNNFNVKRIKGGSGSTARARDGRKFGLKRDEMVWRLREGLDPEHGDNIALPPGRHILMELTSFREMQHGEMRDTIRIENNDSIVKRIGRSPDLAWGFFFAWAEPDPMAKEQRASHVSSRKKRSHSLPVSLPARKVYGRR